MTNEVFGFDEPCFGISIAARILGVRAETLRYYERLGLVEPHRSRGNQRVYSHRDVERLRRMRTLVDDLGVNLAGVEIVMKLLDRIQEDENELKKIKAENQSMRTALKQVGSTLSIEG